MPCGGLPVCRLPSFQEAVDAINERGSEAKVLNGLKRLINLSLNSHDHALEFAQMGGIASVNTLLQVTPMCAPYES